MTGRKKHSLSGQELWGDYWRDIKTTPIERLIQFYKSRWGYGKFVPRVLANWGKGRILEVGAGLAYVSRILAERTKSEIFALDYNFDVCLCASRLAREKNTVITLIQGNIQQLPFPDDSFEVIVSTGVLEHFEERKILLMIAEMRRVSRIVIANLPQKNLFWKLFWSLRRRLGSSLDPHQKLYEPKEMLDLFQKVGFADIDITTLRFGGIFPYISLVAIK